MSTAAGSLTPPTAKAHRSWSARAGCRTSRKSGQTLTSARSTSSSHVRTRSFGSTGSGAGSATGCSSRGPTIESESRQLEAVIDAVGGRAAVFASSCCCLAASQLAVRNPLKVERIVYFGGYATRNDIPDAMRASLDPVHADQLGLAAQMFASLFDPHAGGDEIQKYTRMQRKAATAEAASIFLELDLTADLRGIVPQVAVPALVLHRRGDRTVPIARGRELASLLPNARFVPLGGDAHVPWKDDQRELFRALAGFLQDAAPAEVDDGSPLTSRETEVLRLVATGMSNREIASTLVLSEHTVHRHIANILRKLAQSTRVGAATHATRVGPDLASRRCGGRRPRRGPPAGSARRLRPAGRARRSARAPPSPPRRGGRRSGRCR